MIILKTVYNGKYKGFSSAILLTKSIIKDLMENNAADTIEFFERIMDWHKKWTDDIRTLYHLNYLCFPVLTKLMKLTISHSLFHQKIEIPKPVGLDD